MVDGGQRGQVAQQCREQLGVHGGGPLGDDRLLGQHDGARGLGVGRQQPPVHVSAVAQVRVVRLLWRARANQNDKVGCLLRCTSRLCACSQSVNENMCTSECSQGCTPARLWPTNSSTQGVAGDNLSHIPGFRMPHS